MRGPAGHPVTANWMFAGHEAFLLQHLPSFNASFRAKLSKGGFTMTEPADIDKGIAPTSRRRFLREGGALLGGAVVAGGLGGREALGASEGADNLPPNVPEWMKTPGHPMGSQTHG